MDFSRWKFAEIKKKCKNNELKCTPECAGCWIGDGSRKGGG